MSDPILFPCANCGSGSGEPCVTKGGQRKDTCPIRGRGQKGTSFAATAPPVAPKFTDPGPALKIADVPGMPAEAATYFAMRGATTLADLRPLVEGHAAADAQCEPVFELVGGKGFELPLLVRYKAGDSLIALLGGRVHMLKVMAGWSVPSAPEPVPPAPVEDFDENSPPPKRRPPGPPIERYVMLPLGEEPVGIFAQWDREGRVPAGAVFVRRVGVWPLGSGKASGYVLLAVSGANPFGVRPSEEIPADQFAPYHLLATVKAPSCPDVWAVFCLRKGGA